MKLSERIVPVRRSSRFKLAHVTVATLAATAAIILWTHHNQTTIHNLDVESWLHIAGEQPSNLVSTTMVDPNTKLKNARVRHTRPHQIITRAAAIEAARKNMLQFETTSLMPEAPSDWPARTALAANGLAEEQAKQYHIYDGVHTSVDTSHRCMESYICDDAGRGCGESKLGCVTSAEERRLWIAEAMATSWSAYRKHAWGHDELAVTPNGALTHLDWMGMGLSIVDSLDTLLIMNMTREYQHARDWVVNSLDMSNSLPQVSVFEVNIRIIGGLLSAFAITGGKDAALLRKAQEVADRMMPAFNTLTGVPHTFWDFSGRTGAHHSDGGHSKADVGRTNIAAAGTFSMELATLSRYTGDDRYINTANRFWSRISQLQPCDGLYCTWFDAEIMSCIGEQEFGFGASADSFYEYMLKQWIMTGGRDVEKLELYKGAVAGSRAHLVMKIDQNAHPGKHAEGQAGTSAAGARGKPWRLRKRNSKTSDAAAAGAETGAVSEDGLSTWEHPFWIIGMGKHNEYMNDACPASYVSKLKPASGSTASTSSSAAANAVDKVESLLTAAKVAAVEQGQTKQTRMGGSFATDMEQAAAEIAVLDTAKRAVLSEAENEIHAALRLRGSRGVGDSADTANRGARKLSDIASASVHSNLPPAVTPRRQLQHFSCFVPGMLTLGHLYGIETSIGPQPLELHDEIAGSEAGNGNDLWDVFGASVATPPSQSKRSASSRLRPAAARTVDDLMLASKLARGCYELYRGSPSGVAGDSMEWSDVRPVDGGPTYQWPIYTDQKNYLRPEVIESLFYLWRATHDQVYRDWGWNIFRAFHQHSRLRSGAYTTLESAVTSSIRPGDRQESFWMAETLKYLYLLFSDEPHLLPLSSWVFNTEAHPFPVWGSAADRAVMAAIGRTVTK